MLIKKSLICLDFTLIKTFFSKGKKDKSDHKKSSEDLHRGSMANINAVPDEMRQKETTLIKEQVK